MSIPESAHAASTFSSPCSCLGESLWLLDIFGTLTFQQTLKNGDQINGATCANCHTKTRIGHEQRFPSGLCFSQHFKKLPLCLLAHISRSIRITTYWRYGFRFQRCKSTDHRRTEGKLGKTSDLVLAPCPSSLSALGVPGGKTRSSPLVDNCRRRNGCKNGHKPQVRPRLAKCGAWSLSQFSIGQFCCLKKEPGYGVDRTKRDVFFSNGTLAHAYGPRQQDGWPWIEAIHDQAGTFHRKKTLACKRLQDAQSCPLTCSPAHQWATDSSLQLSEAIRPRTSLSTHLQRCLGGNDNRWKVDVVEKARHSFEFRNPNAPCPKERTQSIRTVHIPMFFPNWNFAQGDVLKTFAPKTVVDTLAQPSCKLHLKPCYYTLAYSASLELCLEQLKHVRSFQNTHQRTQNKKPIKHITTGPCSKKNTRHSIWHSFWYSIWHRLFRSRRAPHRYDGRVQARSTASGARWGGDDEKKAEETKELHLC